MKLLELFKGLKDRELLYTLHQRGRGCRDSKIKELGDEYEYYMLVFTQRDQYDWDRKLYFDFNLTEEWDIKDIQLMVNHDDTEHFKIPLQKAENILGLGVQLTRSKSE